MILKISMIRRIRISFQAFLAQRARRCFGRASQARSVPISIIHCSCKGETIEVSVKATFVCNAGRPFSRHHPYLSWFSVFPFRPSTFHIGLGVRSHDCPTGLTCSMARLSSAIA